MLGSPCWSGIINDGRPYSPFCINIERLVPWRTLTGRQHFYLDHEGYIGFSEHLATYKPRVDPLVYGDLKQSSHTDQSITLNYLTPQGKWHIHSTYYDNLRMLTLSLCIFYHSPERTISVPKSPMRANRRAGGHNSLTRTRLKPVLMVGGYGQFTYGFNYWGPTGVNRDTHVILRRLPAKPQF